MSFDRLKFVNLSDRERRSKKQRANEWKLKRLMNDESIHNLVASAFTKMNESKNLVNETYDRDLAVGDTPKCKEEKNKGENGKNTAVNLTTEANRTLTYQKACLDKNSNFRKSLNFPKVSYATILKQLIRTVGPTSAIVFVPPQVSASLNVSGSSHDLTKGDDSLLGNLPSLGVSNDNFLETDSDRIKGSFSSDSVFNLSKKVLSETEIKVLEKGLGFSPTPSFINEADLQRDFDDFARKMRCKWYFRNESQYIPSQVSTCKLKSTWNPPKGSPALELFLNKVKEDIFSVLPGRPKKFNLNREEYLTMRSLQNDRSVIIKPADKGSAVVVWDRQDYLKEAERQLSDSSIYKEVKVTEKDLVDLVDKSNKIFVDLERRNIIQEKEKNYFKFNFKKATNVGKFYLLPKIHKSLSKVPGRPVISNCGMPTEKISEFLDHHLQPLMKQGESYIKDTGDFLEKLKRVGEIPKGAIFVTADVVGFYLGIPHDGGLEVLRKQYDKFKDKIVPTEDIIKMAEFVFRNNLFETDCIFYQQISGTNNGTKFTPPYACIFMD